jgi:hypothetical protein
VATRVKNDRGRVLYLYGIGSAPPGPAPNIAGVDGAAPVEGVVSAGLVCWVSLVAKTEFADQLARNMENLDWLAEVSVRHQRVVASIAETADILPARFGTVFLSRANLDSDVAQRKAVLLEDLARIRGCEEWGVKVFGKPAKPAAQAAPRSGREYLQARAGLLRSRAEKGPDPELERLASRLQEVAVEITAGGAISGGQPGLQWQASLLLKRSRRNSFQAVVEKFAADWSGDRRLECTGPWPPYSFVSRIARPTGAED